MITGVYCWKNILDNKVYVGSASYSLSKRKSGHLYRLKLGNHHSIYFQQAWNKYGKESFIFEILEKCLPDKCIEREQYYIDKLKAANPKFGYNISTNAGNTLGVTYTPEGCENVGKAKRGGKLTEEHKKKISIGLKNSKAFKENRELKEKLRKKPIKRRNNSNIRYGINHPKHKLTKEDVINIKIRLKNKEIGNSIAKIFNISSTVINKIKLGYIWKNITINEVKDI